MSALPIIQPPGILGGVLAVAMTEIPSGVVNGTNSSFQLSKPPMVNTQIIFKNGIAMFPGNGDYLISGNMITFNQGAIPQPGDTLIAVYWASPN